MEYDRLKLEEVKFAIKDYMYNRFPSKNFHDIIPTFDNIKQQKQVMDATSSLLDNSDHYTRQAIKELLDSGDIIIKRRGELHAFNGDSKDLDSMFKKITSDITKDNNEEQESSVNYKYLPSQLGYGTPYDITLSYYAGVENNPNYLDDL